MRPDVVVIGDVKRAVELGIGGAVRPHAAQAENMPRKDALGQPDAAGVYLLHLLARLAPERSGHGARHVAAEAVNNLRPDLQRLDLVFPQVEIPVIEVDDVRPLRHAAGRAAQLVAQEELRMPRSEDGVG